MDGVWLPPMSGPADMPVGIPAGMLGDAVIVCEVGVAVTLLLLLLCLCE